MDRWTLLSRGERRALARALRRLGLSYGEIATLLPVAKATLAGWCRGIVLSPAATAAIRARTAPGSRAGVPVDTQWRRRAEIVRIRAAARRSARGLVSDPLWIAGVVLY